MEQYEDAEYYEEGVEDDEEEDEEEEDEEYDTEDGEEAEALEAEDDRDRAEEWQGKPVLPARTWESLIELVGKLSAAGKTELTVLVIGKPAVGRSSTVNSLLCEQAAEANSGIQVSHAPRGAHIYARTSGSFMLRVIDTPALVAGDKVSTAAFQEIAQAIAPRRVDVVLYVDRLDIYRIEPIDRHVLRAVTQHFGAAVWKRTIIALTRGSCTPPAGYAWPAFAAKRAALLQAAVRRAGGSGDVPAVILENSSRCAVNSDGEKVLPDGTVWMTEVMRQVVALSLAQGKGLALKFKPYNPNRKRLWLIPVLVALQYAAHRYLFQPVIEADGWRGDRHGDYDAETAREERLLAQARKAEAQRELERQRKANKQMGKAEQQKAAALAAQASKSGFKDLQYEDDDEADDSDFD